MRNATPHRRTTRPAEALGAFTLLELLVVIAIMLLMTGTAVLGFEAMFSSSGLETAGALVANTLWEANAAANFQREPHMVVLNRGTRMIRVFSAGKDGKFATAKTESEIESVILFQDDDEPVAELTRSLGDVVPDIWILQILDIGEVNEDEVPPVEEEETSAVFIFTTEGVEFGIRDENTGLVLLKTSLQTTPDQYDENEQADIVLRMKGGRNVFWMIVDPVMGRAEWKVIPLNAVEVE